MGNLHVGTYLYLLFHSKCFFYNIQLHFHGELFTVSFINLGGCLVGHASQYRFMQSLRPSFISGPKPKSLLGWSGRWYHLALCWSGFDVLILVCVCVYSWLRFWQRGGLWWESKPKTQYRPVWLMVGLPVV